ncbi:hypothetical protein ACIQD1_13600 [Streptomyces sp. NPDC093088]|uniref:hypothetical protein n=1 Tax=Streptomyces sp. NPDC093088 TaxID=3366023 RepID=UPI003829783B
MPGRLVIRRWWAVPTRARAATEFLLGTGPGRHLTERADAETRARVRRTLEDRLRTHETADGTVRLLSTCWLVTADRPA